MNCYRHGKGAEVKIAQSTLIYAHVRRDLVEAGASTQSLLDDINAKVAAHGGVVLANRQFLRRPIEMSWHVDTYLDDYTSAPFEHPDLEWGEAQRRYFGDLWDLRDPYRYACERAAYDQFCVSARDPTPYLVNGEVIYALIETMGSGGRLIAPVITPKWSIPRATGCCAWAAAKSIACSLNLSIAPLSKESPTTSGRAHSTIMAN